MKTQFFSKFIGTSLSLGLCACATSTFSVSSDPPQAEVYVQAPGLTTSQAPGQPAPSTQPGQTPAAATPERKAVGRTPFTIPMSEFKAIVGNTVAPGQFFPIVIERQGFLPETLLIPATRFGTFLTSINVKLRPEPVITKDEKAERLKDEKTARAVIDHLFLAQKFAITQQFERAQIEIDKILTEFPTFPRALSMRASIYYAQKNWPEALKWYEEAIKADPQMDDAVKMTAKIRAIQSGRMPANENAPGAQRSTR